MPGVAESAVVGLPHPDFGEGVIAVVVAKAGTMLDGDAIVARIERQNRQLLVPKRVFIAADLPRNAMGKVQKNLLRQEHAKLFES